MKVDDAWVAVTLGSEVVARDDRVLASHVTVTDPAHDAARKASRALANAPRPTLGSDIQVNRRAFDGGSWVRPGRGLNRSSSWMPRSW